MKTLPLVRATPEQLPIISSNQPGAEVIRGAAGSGKTSTALLRLRSLLYMFQQRRVRQGSADPVRILVLTFNRTLAGYISRLAETQVEGADGHELQITTFAKWALGHLQDVRVHELTSRRILNNFITRAGIPTLTVEYLHKEVDYLLGRFLPADIDKYVDLERTGRGIQPRVERTVRRSILDRIVSPYLEQLSELGILDWNGLAVRMSQSTTNSYDVVVVDESQDFSANQLRAIRHHLADIHAVTFVIDTVQRIYARGFTWAEAGFAVRPERFHTLRANHRNTKEIAAFAMGVLADMPVDGDGALPNLDRAERHGRMPQVLRGRYEDQLRWAFAYIREFVDLTRESVAFLAPRARWLGYTKERLRAENLAFADITRDPVWPEGDANIALCTFHSAKGLEFDHVFILGLSSQNTTAGDEEGDDEVLVQRRLLAVAIARARHFVALGYKPGEESHLVAYLDPATFEVVEVG